MELWAEIKGSSDEGMVLCPLQKITEPYLLALFCERIVLNSMRKVGEHPKDLTNFLGAKTFPFSYKSIIVF